MPLFRRRVLNGFFCFGTILYVLVVYFVLKRKRNVLEETFEHFDKLNEKNSSAGTLPKRPPQTMPPLKNGFQLVFPHIEPKLSPENQILYLVVMVTSSAKGEDHRTLRKTIRLTWGDTKLSDKNTPKWKMFFSLAISDKQQENEANEKEALEYNDVIIGNFTEKYQNLVMKVFMGHYWVINRLSCRVESGKFDDSSGSKL
ncbi:Beta-1,3-galactosyltransferase 5 [Exaiptasia diaphana]|nr:Beta-1,3-galactosyltransferase 5 [Exaiptasia diaphana]